MKIEKKFLTDLHRCYATSSTVIDGDRKILIATEGEGPCFMYELSLIHIYHVKRINRKR